MADRLDALATQLQASAAVLRQSPDVPEEQRTEIIASAEAISNELKQPMDQLFGTMIGLTTFCSIRLFLKWKLFEKIPTTGSVSYEELAEGIGAETALICKSVPAKGCPNITYLITDHTFQLTARFGAALVSTGVLQGAEKGKVAHTSQSAVYASPKSVMGALVCHG